MATDLNQTGEPQPAAAYCQPECDWTTMTHQLCGAPISIPRCAVCGRVNGDAIRRQVGDIVAERTAELRAALAGAEQATTDARRAYEHLNRPMLDRLRKCAADTSPNWDGVVTVYPPETRGLVALIDAVGALAADVPAAAEEETHRRDEHEQQACPTPGCSICEALWLAATGKAIPDVPAAGDHGHPGGYLSTACLHGHHGVCGGAQHQRGDLTAPHCKFCDVPCSCPKHTDPLAPCKGGARKRRHHPSCAQPDDDNHLGWCGPNADVPAAGEAEVTP